ncbi:MAG: hypothetical protein KIG97_12720 [Fibrobacter sp.]|uniref:hypothetical protein n=1 Tax=Fibrobacter sp. TaxID=35828 RepID=UPI0025C23779|nr:hypothetical protein [Fibrobacter sp.]MBS7273194.1 hypothetical protein [Fibrobacter sp.]
MEQITQRTIKTAHLFLLLAFHVLVMSVVANAKVIERFPDGKPKIVETVTAGGQYRYENHTQYMEKTGQPCHIVKKTYKNDRLFSISEAGGDCKYWPDFGSSFVNIEEDMVTTQYNERGKIISKTGPGWEKRYDDNGHLIYEKSSGYEKKCKSNGYCEVIQKTNRYTIYSSCKGNNCLITKIISSGMQVCSGDEDCRDFLAKENQKAVEKRKIQHEKWEKERVAEEARKEKEYNQKKAAFLKQYDSDGDGFCTGDYEMQLMSNLCDGDDLCPKTPGKYDGCTLKQKIKMDNDTDRDGFCDDDEIYQKHSELFEALDLCPDLKGESPDGCTEEVRAMRKEDAKETIEQQIRQLFDSDNDGFCSEEFVCLDKWGECAKYAAALGINGNLSFKNYTYFNPFLSKAETKAAIAEAKGMVCTEGYVDACPDSRGNTMGCADRHLREYVKKTYGDYDPDHDGFCDKWVGEKGLWRAMGNGCNQDYLDECPTKFGGERGCPRQQDNSFARQKANRPKGRCCPPGAVGCHDNCTQSERNSGGRNYDNGGQNNGNGLFVNGKKVKFW